MSLEAIAADLAGGGVGGAIVIALIGAIKKAMAGQAKSA